MIDNLILIICNKLIQKSRINLRISKKRMVIFKSHYDDVKIPEIGVYQFITSNPNKIPDSKAIYIDAITHKKLTFGEFKRNTKRLAAGLQNHLGFRSGDTLCIYSVNQVNPFLYYSN